ncbi:MAG: ADP-ribosylglycohydrolase family protein [bacterium]
MKITWIDPLDLIRHELQQQTQEGHDVSSVRGRWERLQSTLSNKEELRRNALVLLDEMSEAVARHSGAELAPFHGRAPLRAFAAPPLSKPALSRDELLDRILGGWLGRAAGCLLGKPVEKHSRAVIRGLLDSNNTWPLSDYITAAGIPQALLQKYPWNRHHGRESLKENIVCMTEDDDMNYTMLNLHVLETFGPELTTENVAECWLSMLPVLSTFTAERVAYLNLLQGRRPPESAMFRNPYREWIGAQIRADLWGWVAAGHPALAAELAWRDARLSHLHNGIHGEMFFAAAIAAAFVYPDPQEIMAQGLQQIPEHSRFAEAIRFTLALPHQEKEWECAVDRLYEKFGHYHWVHAINNAALVVAALLYGACDYERSICNVVMAGWDTDSNGATVGSILGTMLGAKGLPEKWSAPLNNRMRSSLKGFDNSAFEDLAKRTLAQIVAL